MNCVVKTTIFAVASRDKNLRDHDFSCREVPAHDWIFAGGKNPVFTPRSAGTTMVNMAANEEVKEPRLQPFRTTLNRLMSANKGREASREIV